MFRIEKPDMTAEKEMAHDIDEIIKYVRMTLKNSGFPNEIKLTYEKDM